MKFGFVTCVRLGLGCMEEIYNIGGELALVITLHDHLMKDKSGRIYVDEFCMIHNIPILKVKNINEPEAVNAIIEKGIDWLFIIGWSQIARKDILIAPKKACLGMHPTLLPQGRGRAAIPWAILKGLDKTGVTLFKLDENVDTGPIIAQEVINIEPRETATTLYSKVIEAHKTLIRKVWDDLLNDRIKFIPQDENLATTWPGRKPEEGEISLEMNTDEVDKLVRAVTDPYPGAFVIIDSTKYIIWAGEPHKGINLESKFLFDEVGHLWIETTDGCFEAIRWEREEVVKN